MHTLASLLSLLLLASGHALADEKYEFVRVTCDKMVPSLQFERVEFWNIGHLIWPTRNNWVSHQEALKKLEQDAGLYVFAELYGHYDVPSIAWGCGAIQATVVFDKLERPNPQGAAQSPVYVRSYPRISVRYGEQEIVKSLAIQAYTVHVYSDYKGSAYLKICSREHVCKEDLASAWAPLDTEKAANLLTKD